MSNDLEHKRDISVARCCKGLTMPNLYLKNCPNGFREREWTTSARFITMLVGLMKTKS